MAPEPGSLVGRRQEPLDLLAKELTSAGATAHVITADLSHTGATPRLAEQIRAKAGNLDAFYYAPTPDTGFVSAANLTPQHAQNFMPLIFYTMLALVQEFLPHVREQGDGAILTAQGGSTVQGLPNMSGPSPAQAAQRNRSATTRAARSSSSPRKTADSIGPDHRGRTWPPGCLIALIALPSRNRSVGVPAAEDALGDGRRADDGEQPQEHR